MIQINHQNYSLAGTKNEDIFGNGDYAATNGAAKASEFGVKIESEEEEEEYEEIIDDEFEEVEVDEAKGQATVNKQKEGSCFGLGSLEQPLVKFYFTSPCPELGLDKVTHFFLECQSYVVFLGE